ncbi:FAD-dependent oxidoreductase [Streptomyces sp. NPDC050988]|uniref:FAD-dependent oxidoreductase n=1 Tax=Streptomyces sp. NPDC050988 TaxID=3365637 RepID=UPI0037973779
MKQTDVVVVGAGPVGVLNALGLARAGVSVTLLESEPAIVQSPRAVVYHWSVLEGIERLGILDEAVRAGFTKQDYTYLVLATGERISMGMGVLEGRVRHPYNLHLGQHRLAEIALEHLRRLGATVSFGTRVTGLAQDDDGVTVTAETPDGPAEFRAGWVIGADGARSAVRGLLGLDFEGMTWPERFVATNIRYDFEAHGYGRSTLQIDARDGAIIAKIDETGLWRCTYCEPLDLPEEEVQDRMPAVFERILPGAEGYELVQYSPYRMHQRAATRFRAGRVLLAGDAAHATNPAGGLGLTSGLFDTFVLYDALAAVVQGRAEDDVLDRYAEERRRVFLDVASPAAGENKRLIYHSEDPARLAQDLDRLRRMAKDEQLLLERFLFSKRIETPALVRSQKD